MNAEAVTDILRETIMIAIQISAPVMVVGLVVGVVIALVQALTQIQEITLVFVPKIIAIFLTIFVLFPGMMTILIAFTERLAERMIAGQ